MVCLIGVVWAKNLCCFALRDLSFRMKINLGVTLICSLVYVKRISGCLRSRSGLGVVGSEETHQAGKEQKRFGSPSNLTPWTLLGCSTFYPLTDLRNIFNLWFGNTRVLCHVVSGILRTIFFVKSCKFLLISQMKQLSIHFFPPKPRLFHLSTENKGV